MLHGRGYRLATSRLDLRRSQRIAEDLQGAPSLEGFAAGAAENQVIRFGPLAGRFPQRQPLFALIGEESDGEVAGVRAHLQVTHDLPSTLLALTFM